jgi:hypothetical protein
MSTKILCESLCKFCESLCYNFNYYTTKIPKEAPSSTEFFSPHHFSLSLSKTNLQWQQQDK